MRSTPARVLQKKLAEEKRANLKPPPKLTVSEWADEYRRLSSESSAEPGRWLTARAEYQRGIMDAVSDPGVHTVIVMSSAQVGKTEVLNNVVGFHIHQDPAPILLIQPTLEMAQTWSKDRLAPMLRDSPELRGKVKDPRPKNSQNTMLHKTFPGGHITMAGSNSPASLASRPVRIVLFDEVDRYPPSAGTEGDPVNLGRKRTATFWNRTVFLTSTPTVKGVSRIELEFSQSDQRYFFVPCPHCDHFQRLVWAQVVWDKTEEGENLPDTAHYVCEKCGAMWTEIQRQVAVKRGVWRATAQSEGKAGFHLSELYSPWSSLQDVVRAFLDARGNPELLKTWVNTSLGETWEDEGDSVDQHVLYRRRERYEAQVPNDALLLTAGIDVQRDRVEMEVVAWGHGEESWNVDYRIIPGDTARPEVWRDLEDALDLTYTHETGTEFHITSALIDSSDQTTTVYNFVKHSRHPRLFAGKGISGTGRPVVQVFRKQSSRAKRGVDLYHVGVDDAKATTYARLMIKDVGPGYCHFPMARDPEYFDQLTAERLVTKYHKGFAKKEWVKVRPRNEVLDCRVYAYAALKILNPVWTAIEKKLRTEPTPVEEPTLPRTTQRRKRPVKTRKVWATDI